MGEGRAAQTATQSCEVTRRVRSSFIGASVKRAVAWLYFRYRVVTMECAAVFKCAAAEIARIIGLRVLVRVKSILLMRATPLIHLFCLCLLWPGLSDSSHAQSNIVLNGSFEELGSYWNAGSLSIFANQGAADGIIHIGVIGGIYQDLETVPGRTYVLSFAIRDDRAPSAVTWGATTVSSYTNFATLGLFWKYVY